MKQMLFLLLLVFLMPISYGLNNIEPTKWEGFGSPIAKKNLKLFCPTTIFEKFEI